MLVASSETDLAYIKSHIECEAEFEEVILNYTFEKALDTSLFKDKKIDNAIIVSYYGYKEIAHEFSINGIKSICIYEYFIQNGLFLEHNYYDFIMSKYSLYIEYKRSFDFCNFSGYLDIYYEKKIWHLSKNDTLKEFHLKRIIFLCLYIKDFIYAKKYIDEYISQGYSSSDKLITAYAEIEKLLERIKSELLCRKTKDAIMFWIDALDIVYVKRKSFLKDIDKNVISFKQAYTANPWTTETFRSIMHGKQIIDDKTYLFQMISDENSSFLRVLKENSADFVICSFLRKHCEKHCAPKEPIFRNTPTTVCFWTAISETLRRKKSVFVLTHELLNTHRPNISVANNGEKLFLSNMNKQQYEESLLYAEEQLVFYNSLLPEKMIKIFISDHNLVSKDFYFNTFLKIQCHEKKREIEKIFSYVNFHKLVEWLYNPNSSTFNKLFSDCAEIQSLDAYGYMRMNEGLPHKFHLMFGRRAITTDNETYIHTSNNVELFYNNKPNKDFITPKRLDELRAMTGNHYIDPYSDEYLKYSRYLWQLKDNYFKRCDEFEQRKKHIIKTLFKKLNGKNVAIMAWEEDALLYLFSMLYPDLNGVIKYIIVKEKTYLRFFFGRVEIVLPEDIDKHNIDVVVLPSFNNRKMLKEILNEYHIEIIDLYEYLAENDINCTLNFFGYELSVCDFDFNNIYKRELQIIKALFEELKGKTVAIRTGGETAAELLYLFRPHLNGVVKYIIDNNPNCKCEQFAWIKVIPPKDVENYNIDVIIMPSFGLRKTLKNELQHYSAKVIDLYEYLEEYGTKRTSNLFAGQKYFKVPVM
jgi:hypothetical protein